jgi:hypothetical protein
MQKLGVAQILDTERAQQVQLHDPPYPNLSSVKCMATTFLRVTSVHDRRYEAQRFKMISDRDGMRAGRRNVHWDARRVSNRGRRVG